MQIVTDGWAKPIPDRRFDWRAYDDDTYDGEGCTVGWGSTEAEAIADLMEQAEDDDTPRRCPRCDEMRGSDQPEGCRDPNCPRTA